MHDETYHFKRCPCPYCGNINDTANKVVVDIESGGPVSNSTPPTPGSVNICMYCGNPSIFNDKLKLRRMSYDEINELRETDPDSATIIKKSQMVITKIMIRNYLQKQGISLYHNYE